MMFPYSLRIKETDVPGPGYDRPSVLISWEDYELLDVGFRSVIEVVGDGIGEPLFTFIEPSLSLGLSRGECGLTASVSNALPDGLDHISITPSDPPKATEVRTGRPQDVHISMSGAGAPEAVVDKATTEVIESLQSIGTQLHVGQMEKAEDGNDQSGVSVYLAVQDITPGLVAVVTDDTELKVRGQDWY